MEGWVEERKGQTQKKRGRDRPIRMEGRVEGRKGQTHKNGRKGGREEGTDP